MFSKLLTIALFAAISSMSGAADKSKLDGKWMHNFDHENNVTIRGYTVYSSDGTFHCESDVFRNEKVVESLVTIGTWRIKGKTMTMRATYSNKHDITDKPEIQCEIIEITELRYTYKLPSGKIVHEIRASE